MQVIGFNFTKISAKRENAFERFSLNTNIEFVELQKEKMALLKDSNAIKIGFKYSVNYSQTEEKNKDEKLGDMSFQGYVVFAVNKKEEKDLLKNWKDKKVPENLKIPLFNLILKKCSPKAVYLADELSLPSPVPLPKVQAKA